MDAEILQHIDSVIISLCKKVENSNNSDEIATLTASLGNILPIRVALIIDAEQYLRLTKSSKRQNEVKKNS